MAVEKEIVLRRNQNWMPLQFSDLLEYRDLLFFLVWRDVKVKYKQTVLGVGWVLFRPLIGMVIFTVLFGKLARFPSQGVPYPIFVLLGLLPWNYFSSSLAESSTSLVGNTNLISKVYFPRLLIPLSSAIANLLDLLVSMVLLLFLMVYYGTGLQPGLVLAPFLLLAVFIAMIGPGILLSAVNVKYHDVKYVVPFLVQAWMFLTPVIYPVDFVPERYRLLMYLNPMTGPIESFRAAVLGHAPLNAGGLAISLTVSVLVLLAGLTYFRKLERTFADVI